ncbi:MAG: protein translocase subunit SecD, partial [Candidatus Ancillula sp.]|nr:protein translocase subunit SecD [Candidatus Ancillula sp.]
MAKKVKTKQSHPVRTLVILILAMFLIYGSVGFGVVQENWSSISSNAQNWWSGITGKTSTDTSDITSGLEDSAAEPGDNSAEPDSSDSAAEENSDSDSSSDQIKVANVSFIPKFALDLAGGTEIILTPVSENGEQITDTALDQAIDVIRQRIDASGVAESEIQKQGGSNITVGIPGQTPSDETIKLISNAAHMVFRPVIVYGGASSRYYSSAMGDKSATQDQTNQSSADANGDGSLSEQETNDWIAEMDAKDQTSYESLVSSDTAKGTSKYSSITADDIAEFDALDCTKSENLTGGSSGDPEKPLATCSQDGAYKYMLGPVAVDGSGISKASSGLEPLSNGKYSSNWIVSLEFKEDADQQFIDISEQLKVLDSPRNQFAITLDGLVISAPQIDKDTTFVKGNGVQISGGTDSSQTWANTLANQLSFGALPMSFKVDSKEQVSATLGSEQLQKGLLAGLIGLLLVALYSIFQYRALGLVTIGSLTIATVFSYGIILLLSWQIGYRMSLPGIIGFIVSIGVTADSFIVYFERIRDELRDNRSLDYAVQRGWQRAVRTILASDFINILAAVILYFLAVGGVQGFAFTLGLTTLVDLIVVTMFTHPIVQIVSKHRFFALGHPASGLSAYHLGAADAKQYVALTAEEKAQLKEDKKLAKEAKKAAKAERKALVSTTKTKSQARKQQAKIDKRAHDLEMAKRNALLKAGADEDEVVSAHLTIAERKALAEGKNPKDIAKTFAVQPEKEDTKTTPSAKADTPSKKGNLDGGSKAAATKKTATTKKASVAKTTVKPVAKKEEEKKEPVKKPAVNKTKTTKKAAVKTTPSAKVDTPS